MCTSYYPFQEYLHGLYICVCRLSLRYLCRERFQLISYRLFSSCQMVKISFGCTAFRPRRPSLTPSLGTRSSSIQSTSILSISRCVHKCAPLQEHGGGSGGGEGDAVLLCNDIIGIEEEGGGRVHTGIGKGSVMLGGILEL